MKKYDNCVVFFIDVLGYKSFNSFDDKYRVHRTFHEEIKKNEEIGNSDGLNHVIHERKLFSFSDCAYIIYRYKENIDESRKDKNKLIEVALFNTSLLLAKFFLSGYLMRGGVSYGEAYYDSFGCFGPAVEDAYFLESNKDRSKGIVTEFPRISLSPSFSEEQYSFERRVGTYFRNKKSVSYLILHDDDGVYFLNVFYLLEMEGGISGCGSHMSFSETIKKLMVFADQELRRNNDNLHVSKKILWYIKYLKQLECRLNNLSGSVIFDVE